MVTYGEVKRNLIASVAFLAFALFMILFAIPTEINVKSGLLAGESSTESRLFPYFASGIMGIAAIIQIAKNLYSYSVLRKSGVENTEHVDIRKELKALAILALCVVYSLLFSAIGYIAASVIVTPIALFVMGGRKWQYYVSVLAVALIMYIIFEYVLYVPLP